MSLFKKEKREVFRANFKNSKDDDFGESFVSLSYKDNKPVEVEILPLKSPNFYGKELMHIIVETSYEIYHFHFSSLSSWDDRLRGIIENTKIILKNNTLMNENSQYKVSIVIPEIGFLNFKMNSFIIDFFESPDKRTEVIEKFSHQLKGLNNFIYRPFADFRYEKYNTGLAVKGFNSFEYSINTKGDNPDVLEILENAKNNSLKIIRVINLLCKSNSKLDSIYIKNEKQLLLSYFEKSDDREFRYNNYGVDENSYFKIIKQILQVILESDRRGLELFWCITNRMERSKKETDITIKVVLLHSVLQLLLKYFAKDNSFSSNNIISKNFRKIPIQINEEESDSLVLFNKYRNEIFKNIFEINEYPNPVALKKSYNVTIKFIGILLSKFFFISDDVDNDFQSIIRFIHSF
ncbi:MAG: hypothetical protein K8I03_11625 [Ignavibacteria bacterium]|nr:hypothetical protein [Ignavibacteria bacterium]